MKVKPAYQILWKGNSIYGQERIRRGSDGNGYFWEGNDTIYGKLRFCLPVDQDFIAERYRVDGKEWRTE